MCDIRLASRGVWMAPSRRKAAPVLAGGYRRGDRVYFVGTRRVYDDGVRCEYMQQGMVKGPAAVEDAAMLIAVMFDGHSETCDCEPTELSRTAPLPLPGGYNSGECVYFVGKRRVYEDRSRLEYMQPGIVAGLATREDTRTYMAILFVLGDGDEEPCDCKPSELSRTAPPPLPGGYTSGDWVCYTGRHRLRNQEGDQLENGQCGYVDGPATVKDATTHIAILSEGSSESIDCKHTDLKLQRRTAPLQAPHEPQPQSVSEDSGMIRDETSLLIAKYSEEGKNNVDALIDAAWDGDCEKLALLLMDQVANPNWPHSTSFYTPLAAACQEKKPGKQCNVLVSLLLDAQADANLCLHASPLETACSHSCDDSTADCLSCVRSLLAASAAVNYVSHNGSCGSTPLYAACSNGNVKLVRVLLDAKADVNLSTEHTLCQKANACTPLAMSCEKGYAECVRLLLEAQADVDRGITAGDSLQRIFEDNKPCAVGLTPLMLAATNVHMDVVRMMIAVGASVNAANIQGFTALHWICGYGTNDTIDGGFELEDLVHVLVDAGASLDAVDVDGRTPLDLARAHRRAANAGILMDVGGITPDDEPTASDSECLISSFNSGIALPEMRRVSVVGVTSRPELNGTGGRLVHWKPDGPRWITNENGTSSPGEGRWAVTCDLDGANRLLRPDNLQLCLPRSDDECCICMRLMPAVLSLRTQDAEPSICCGQIICGKCRREHHRTRAAAGDRQQICAMCRQPAPEHSADGFAYLTARAERGDANALLFLSQMYTHGDMYSKAVVPHPERATRYLLQAAEKGLAAAKVEVGAYKCGLHVRCACGHDPLPIPEDIEEGTRLLTEAAALGSGRAHWLLARQEMRGQTTTDNNTYKFRLMFRAAELGDPAAAVALKQCTQGSSMYSADGKHQADKDLGRAIESKDLDELREAIEKNLGIASDDVLQEARRVRDKWKKKARKGKQKLVHIGDEME